MYLRTEFNLLNIINCPVYITDPNCVRYELNFEIQGVSFAWQLPQYYSGRRRLSMQSSCLDRGKYYILY